MTLSIDDLIAEFEPPVRSVAICKKGGLWREYDELREQLEAAKPAARMNQSAATVDIAKRIQELEAEMAEHMVRFSFKGISKNRFAAIKKRFKPAKGQPGDWDPMAGSAAFIAACSLEPEMTEAQVKVLEERIGHGQLDKLFTAAWLATTDDSSVPKSARASALTRESE